MPAIVPESDLESTSVGLNWLIAGRIRSALDSISQNVSSRPPLGICLSTVDSVCGDTEGR